MYSKNSLKHREVQQIQDIEKHLFEYPRVPVVALRVDPKALVVVVELD
jgi:hypothetical protein